MKIAILGGSFNPLHIGHAMLAESVIKELSYDKVIFIPTGKPPHKQIMEGAKPEQRLEMVRAFCQSEKSGLFDVDDCEIRREGLSYTCDTLAYITEKYKGLLEQKPGLIMGEEIACQFEKWKNPDQIVSMADLIIVPRKADFQISGSANHNNIPIGNYDKDYQVKFDRETFKYPYICLKEGMITISSTEIRRRISENRSYKYLVPQAVFDYIERKSIYKNDILN